MGKTRDLFKKIGDIKGHHQIVSTVIRLIIFLQPKIEKLYMVSKIRLRADCGSDHQLLIAKLRLKLKKVGKTTLETEMATHSRILA